MDDRLIQGDSLLVMTSLLEREGMAEQVQCIYIDPPYGIKYGSNWQIKLNNRTVRDADDDSSAASRNRSKPFAIPGSWASILISVISVNVSLSPRNCFIPRAPASFKSQMKMFTSSDV